MEFIANENKAVEIESNGVIYERHAIRTHFVELGENYIDLVERYVKPLYEEGWILSISEKIIALCQNRVVHRKDIHPGFWAKLLCRFVHVTPAGPGAGTPYKMQLIIMQCGLPRVLFAAACSAVTKLFGKKGVFYKVCGQGVGGIDGFYFRSSFDVYKELALINPPNPVELCDKLYAETGIPVVLMDANDIQQDQLGKCNGFPLTDEEIQDAMKDNPSGQGDELTPLILIRPVK